MAEKRGNLYSYDPTTDVAIIGGKSLPEDEQGDLDTDVDTEHPLYDERLTLKLGDPFVAGVDAFGIQVPIKVTKLDGVVVVVAGRQRLRAARKVNRQRLASGQPPLRIDATLERSHDGTRLLGAMILENQARTNDDFGTQITKLKRYLDRGVGIDDAAIAFNMKPAQAKAWLKFDETASDRVRAAVISGKLSVSAGMELARNAKDPAKQDAALDATLAAADSTGKVTTQAARSAAKRIVRPEAAIGCTDKRTQRKLLQALQDASHKGASDKTLSWWEGAEAMLQLVLGDEEADKRVVDLLERVRAAAEK